MLWTIIIILVVLWLLGLLAEIGGALINLILVAAIVLFIWRLISGRRQV